MPLYINGKRVDDGSGSDPLTFEFDGTRMVETVVHDLGRRVIVTYYNTDGDEVEVAVSYVDDDTICVSSVQFLNGTIVVS